MEVKKRITSNAQERLVPVDSKANPAWADIDNNKNSPYYIFNRKIDSIQLDHLYPLDTIMKDHSIDLKRLSPNERLQVANIADNYFLVSRSVNSSRQNKSYENWERNDIRNLIANPKWKEDMANLEVAAKKAVASKISELLKNKKNSSPSVKIKNFDPCKEDKNERNPAK